MPLESRTNLNWTEGPLRDKLQEYERWIRTLDYQVRTLEQERQKLSAIVNHTDAGFLALNRNLQVVWANQIFIDRFGADGPPAPVTGAACHRVLCGREAPCAECPAAKPLTSGITSREFLLQPSSTVSHQEMNLERAGQKRQIYATAMPIRSPEGSVEQVILMLQDITDLQILRESREALQQSETQLRAVLDTVGEGVITIDTAGIIVMVNQEVEKIWGYRPEEIIGRSLALLMPEQFRKRHAAGLQRYLTSGVTHVLGKRLELEGLRKDGSVFPLETYIKETRIGERLFFTAAVRDITERLRVYNDLRQSESRFRSLAETTSAGIFIFQGAKMRYVNAAAERMVGHTRQALLAMDFWEVIHPDFREQVKARGLARQKGASVPSRYEVKLLTKSGEERWVDFSAGIVDFEGSPAVLGTAIDISERKKAEEALQKNEAVLAKTQQMAHLGGWVLDLANLQDINKNELRWTEETFRIFGYEPGEIEVTNELFFQIVHPEDRPKIGEAVAQALAEKTSYSIEHRIVRPDGAERIVHEHADIIFDETSGRPLRMHGSVQDITERKKSENLRICSYKIADAAYGTSGLEELYFFIHQELGRVIDAKNFYLAMADSDRQTLFFPYYVDEHYAGTKSRAPRPMGRGMSEYVLREGKGVFLDKKGLLALAEAGEVEIIGPLPHQWLGVPLKNERNVIGLLAVQSYTRPDAYGREDLSILEFVSGQVAAAIARKQAEEAQKSAEERYRSIFENAMEGIFVSTLEGRILAVNPAFVRMLGYESQEALVAAVTDSSQRLYVQPARRDEFLRELIRNGAVRGFESELFRKDGGRIWVSANVRAVVDADGKPLRLEGVVQDISEQKQLADQLRQAQKIEAVGQLAGGVAHDFNNLLTAITGYTDFVLEQVEADSPLKKDVEEIKKAAERAAALTRQLLAFSRRQMMQPVSLNLNVLVNGMEGMLRRLIGENIELVTVCAPDLAPVKADPHQLEQVIMNLAVNARDAMLEGGRLTIETANAELDHTFVQKHVGGQPGACVLLAVSDSGSGMDAEVQKHLFEPFFTTKEKGKGTGLGLSTVYGIVKQSGGYISIYSEAGHGSCFKIYLPQAVKPALEKPVKTAPAKTIGGTETILLVEDEEAVRKLAAKVLRAKGYTILEAGDGQEAQAVLKEHGETLDLLLTDVVMPKMGGPELAKWLRSTRRRVKVLFMTGYTDHSAFRDGSLPPGTGLIQKPFSPQALAQKVREILDGAKVAVLPSEKTGKQKKPAGQK